jgi:hypothetical protein
LALASEQNSRNCWRTVLGLRSKPFAQNSLTALSPHERVNTIPLLHNAKTVAWGLLLGGMWGVTTAVH